MSEDTTPTHADYCMECANRNPTEGCGPLICIMGDPPTRYAPRVDNVRDVTLREIIKLQEGAKACKSITDWKSYISEFRDKYKLTDRDAISLATVDSIETLAEILEDKVCKEIVKSG